MFCVLLYFTRNLPKTVSSSKVNDYFQEKFSSPPLINFRMNKYEFFPSKTDKITLLPKNVIDNNFQYYSFRGVSGLIKLEPNCKYSFIYEFSPADTITYYDYLNSKLKFYDQNNTDCNYIEYIETRRLQKIDEINVVFNQSSSYCYSLFSSKILFLICLLVGLGSIQVLVLSCCFSEKKIKIRKIFSTTKDLTDFNENEKYKKFNPAIKRKDNQIKKFNENQTCGLNQYYQQPERYINAENIAEHYQKEVINYVFSEESGGVGVVKDLPIFREKYNSFPLTQGKKTPDDNYYNLYYNYLFLSREHLDSLGMRPHLNLFESVQLPS